MFYIIVISLFSSSLFFWVNPLWVVPELCKGICLYDNYDAFEFFSVNLRTFWHANVFTLVNDNCFCLIRHLNFSGFWLLSYTLIYGTIKVCRLKDQSRANLMTWMKFKYSMNHYKNSIANMMSFYQDVSFLISLL